MCIRDSFALVVLVLAAGIFLAVRAQHPAKGSGLQAVVDFGDGVTETLPLAQDHDYLYEVEMCIRDRPSVSSR